MTPSDFVFIRGRVKVTWVTFCEKKVFAPFLKKFDHRAFIMLIALSEGETSINFGLTLSKVKVAMVTFVKTM